MNRQMETYRKSLVRQWTVYIVTIVFLFITPGKGHADEPILLDEFSNVFCTDEFRARIDAFFSEISTRPGMIGVVIWNRDAAIPGRASRYVEILGKHVRFRNFPAERIRFVESVSLDSTKFKFYLVQSSAIARDAEPARPLTIHSTTLFDSSRISDVRKGAVEFGEAIEEPCDLGLNLEQYAEVVRSDANLTVYLVASARTARSRKTVLSALRLTSALLTRSYRIPTGRIRTVYAGSQSETAMQLWLVPKSGQVPRYRAATLP
jgi:hypothetical protein